MVARPSGIISYVRFGTAPLWQGAVLDGTKGRLWDITDLSVDKDLRTRYDSGAVNEFSH